MKDVQQCAKPLPLLGFGSIASGALTDIARRERDVGLRTGRSWSGNGYTGSRSDLPGCARSSCPPRISRQRGVVIGWREPLEPSRSASSPTELPGPMTKDASKKVVYAALAGNLAIAATKLVAAL